jgi:hypothetical protein
MEKPFFMDCCKALGLTALESDFRVRVCHPNHDSQIWLNARQDSSDIERERIRVLTPLPNAEAWRRLPGKASAAAWTICQDNKPWISPCARFLSLAKIRRRPNRQRSQTPGAERFLAPPIRAASRIASLTSPNSSSEACSTFRICFTCMLGLIFLLHFLLYFFERSAKDFERVMHVQDIFRELLLDQHPLRQKARGILVPYSTTIFILGRNLFSSRASKLAAWYPVVPHKIQIP